MNTLTIGGAPIDTHAGQSIQEWTGMLARRNELGRSTGRLFGPAAAFNEECTN